MPAACCDITAIDNAKSLVSAREGASGRTFQFKVANPAQLPGLKVGQKVHANFGTQKVSLSPDGAAPCCNIVNLGAQGSSPMGATASGATSGSTKTKTTTGGGLGSIKTDTSNVKASEGDTATAMRGKPAHASDKRGATTQQSQGGQQAQVSSQTQALNPDVIALQTTSDLVTKDLGFTGLGEITFNLVNRGEVGINVPKKQGGATTMGAQATPSGPPIKIDIYMGSSLIKSVFQPSIVGKQTKNFKENVPSTLPKPKCLETRNLKVVVDPQKHIQELHDDNNVTEAANSARPCPDLAIKSIKRDYSGLLNETYTPKVTIINQGNAPSPETVVWGTSLPAGVWPLTGWPTLVPTRTIPALAPGQTTSFHTGGSVVKGIRTAVRIMLDYHSQIEESDESNNRKDEWL